MNSRRRLRSALYMSAGIACFLLAFFLVDHPHGPEHWSADWRTALLSTRAPAQHTRIILIYVTDNTLLAKPYVSPVDRKILAEIVRAVDAAGAKVIGLDFLFDRRTETQNDDDLINAIHDARAAVVLGGLDDRTLRSKDARMFQEEFLARANRPVGHLYFDEQQDPLIISDHVVRKVAASAPDWRYPKPFAQLLAEAAGEQFRPSSEYISWLLPPNDGSETFMTLPAELLLKESVIKIPFASVLRDKLVLIGGNFPDRDQHLTPLSVQTGAWFTGVFIHAQVLAQLLAHRSLFVWSAPVQVIVAVVASGLGFWVGRREWPHHFDLLIDLSGVAILILLGIVLFCLGAIIFPFMTTLVAWGVGLTSGHLSRPA